MTGRAAPIDYAGLAAAERRRDASRSLLQPLSEASGLEKLVAELAEARAEKRSSSASRCWAAAS